MNDTERLLLGLALIRRDNYLAIRDGIPKQLWGPTASGVWDCIAARWEAGLPPSLADLTKILSATEAGSLVDGLPTLTSIAPIIRRAYVELSDIALRSHLRLALSATDPREQTLRALDAVPAAIDLTGPRSTRDLAQHAFATIELRAEKRGMTGVSTGFTDIDRITGGLQPGALNVLAARPSVGKTALALSIARHAKTLFVSLEMSANAIMSRLIAAESKISHRAIGYGLRDSDWAALAVSWTRVADLPIWIDDSASLTTAQITARAKSLDADLIVVDYLQLVTAEKSVETRQQEISSISRALKRAAKELNRPVLALSQLSRAAESRKDHRPLLSDLRESGAIEQDADVVMLLYRECMYNPTEDNLTSAELIVAKHRDGPTGLLPLRFDPDLTLFSTPEVTL